MFSHSNVGCAPPKKQSLQTRSHKLFELIALLVAPLTSLSTHTLQRTPFPFSNIAMGEKTTRIHGDDRNIEFDVSEDSVNTKHGTTADHADMWRLGKSQELRVREHLPLLMTAHFH